MSLNDKLRSQRLTARESQVAELVSVGLSNKEVATKLCVATKTIKFHLTNIFKKLHLKNRLELIAFCSPLVSREERAFILDDKFTVLPS